MTRGSVHAVKPYRSTVLVMALVAGALATVLLATASASTGSVTVSHSIALKAVPGCGDGAATSLKLRVPVPLPKCAAGYPKAQKLAQPTTLNLSTTFLGEAIAPVLLAQQMGEFAKENLTVKITVAQNPTALPLLASGALDVHFTDFGLTYQSAVNQGLDLKAVLGGAWTSTAGNTSVPQTGIWCRRSAFKDPNSPKIADLNGQTMAALTVPPTTGPLYAFQQLAAKGGLKLNSLHWVVVPAASQQVALDTKAIACAPMGAPFYVPLISQPDKYVMIGTFPNIPTTGYLFGPNLLKKNRGVGEAFVRAMIRTINTYLQGDYHKNATVVQALATALSVTPAVITASPAQTFDYQIPLGTMKGIGGAFVRAGFATRNQLPVTTAFEANLIDRSFVRQAVGKVSPELVPKKKK
jgi:NitT/TauT family transport system substrate-binding protein